MSTRNRDGNMHLRRVRTPFAEDELRKLIAVSEGEWRGLILFGLYVGLRLRDVAMLRHGHIERKANCIHAFATNRCLQSRPIPPPLWRYIQELPTPQNQEQPLFPIAFAQASSGALFRLRSQFKKLISKAGLGDPSQKSMTNGKAEDDYLPLSFASLRYSHVVMLMRSGVAEEIAARICGLRSVAIVSRCSKWDLHSVVERLPDVCSENDD